MQLRKNSFEATVNVLSLSLFVSYGNIYEVAARGPGNQPSSGHRIPFADAYGNVPNKKGGIDQEQYTTTTKAGWNDEINTKRTMGRERRGFTPCISDDLNIFRVGHDAPPPLPSPYFCLFCLCVSVCLFASVSLCSKQPMSGSRRD